MASASSGFVYDPSDRGSRHRILDDLNHFPEIPHKKTRKTASDFTNQYQKTDFAEYYIISHAHEGKDLNKVSPFFIEKALDINAGPGTKTKRLRDGTLLVQCKSENQSRKITSMKTLGHTDFPVKVTEHATLNTTQGIIYCYDAKFLSEEEILNGLQEQKQRVVSVQKIKRRFNGELVDTALCILTFKLSVLPDHIKFGFHQIPVKMYIPNPLRCLNCFKYGHSRKYCKSLRICAQCSELFHENECQTETKCTNCKQAHNNFDKDCIKFKREFGIQTIKVTNKISYYEAKKKYETLNPNDFLQYTTFANTFKTNTNTQRKQTNITVSPTETEEQITKQKNTNEYPNTNTKQNTQQKTHTINETTPDTANKQNPLIAQINERFNKLKSKAHPQNDDKPETKENTNTYTHTNETLKAIDTHTHENLPTSINTHTSLNTPTHINLHEHDENNQPMDDII